MSGLLIGVAILVGVSIGMLGVGGVLLPPALHALTSLSLHEAMATALLTFIFTGLLARCCSSVAAASIGR